MNCGVFTKKITIWSHPLQGWYCNCLNFPFHHLLCNLLAAGQPASWNCWALIQHRRNCERLLRLKDQLSAIDQWTYKLTCQIVKCLKCKSFVNYFLSALRCCHFWTSYLRFNIHILNIQKWEIMKEQFASSDSIKKVFSVRRLIKDFK